MELQELLEDSLRLTTLSESFHIPLMSLNIKFENVRLQGRIKDEKIPLFEAHDSLSITIVHLYEYLSPQRYMHVKSTRLFYENILQAVAVCFKLFLKDLE